MTSAERQPSPHPPADQAAVVQAVTVIMSIGEAGDPLGGGGEQDPVPGLAGADGQWRHRAGLNSCLPTIDPRRLHGLGEPTLLQNPVRVEPVDLPESRHHRLATGGSLRQVRTGAAAGHPPLQQIPRTCGCQKLGRRCWAGSSPEDHLAVMIAA